MSITTHRGDQGFTDLATGERVCKSHLVMQLLGTLDELHAHLSLLYALLGDTDSTDRDVLQSTGKAIIGMSAQLAGATVSSYDIQEMLAILDERISLIEKTHSHPVTFQIIGCPVRVAQIHIARTVCRRAERCLVAVRQCDDTSAERCSDNAIAYLNRLSDYLYLLTMVYESDK